jgi:hypothetical protein
MGKNNIKATEEAKPLFSSFKSYSIDEIIAAGGTTAFADKMGKSAKSLEDALKKIPKDAFLTEEEFLKAMETLNQSK